MAAISHRGSSDELERVVGHLIELQRIRHVTKSSKHRRAGDRVAGADKRYGTGMAKYLPKALGALYCRCGAGALEGLASDETITGQVKGHGNKVSNLTHELPPRYSYPKQPRFFGGYLDPN